MTTTAHIVNSFSNIGMGMSVAAGYVEVAPGRRLWVSAMANSEGKGKRRTWHISAEHYAKNAAGETKPIRVTLTRADCFRVEAAEQVLAELLPFLASL